jgi:hypothetical protein
MVVGSDEEEKMTGLADSEVLADSLIMYVNPKRVILNNNYSYIIYRYIVSPSKDYIVKRDVVLQVIYLL